MSWNDCNLLQIWQAGWNRVSGYSLSAEVHENKPYELREPHCPCGHRTDSLLSEELPAGRELYMNKCENLSGWEHEPLLPPYIWGSQDEGLSLSKEMNEGARGTSVTQCCTAACHDLHMRVLISSGSG